MHRKTLREQIEIELDEARTYLRRSVEGLTEAQRRVERLEALARTLTTDKEEFAADLVAAGIFEHPRPF